MTEAWLLDVGNSRAKLASLEGNSVQASISFPYHLPAQSLAKELEDYLQKQEDWPVWVSCSNPSLQTDLAMVIPETHDLHVISKDQIPMKVSTEGTGVDRLLVTWAAWQMMGSGVIVLDVGTAWTLDVVTEDGTFQGGSIGLSPGLQAEMLHEVCPHLPLADLQSLTPEGIPASTLQAVNAGIWQAFAGATDGLRSAWQEQLGQALSPVLCGGGSQALRPWLGAAWNWQPDLIFHGLAQLVRLHDQG